MLPVLQALGMVEEARTRDIPRLLPRASLGGRSGRPDMSKVTKAMLHLQKAGLVERIQRGVHKISERGRDVLKSPPAALSRQYLRRYPEYQTYEGRVGARKPTAPSSIPIHQEHQKTLLTFSDERTPATLWSEPIVESPVVEHDDDAPKKLEKTKIVKSPYHAAPAERKSQSVHRVRGRTRVLQTRIARAVESLHSELESHLVKEVSALSSEQLVTLVMEILAAYGHGGPNPTVNRSEAEGLGQGSAVLKDALGVNRVYVTATANGTVSASDLQQLKIGLMTTRAPAAVLISNGEAPPIAMGFSAGTRQRVSVLDLEEIAFLMIETGLGITEDSGYEIRTIDESVYGHALQPA